MIKRIISNPFTVSGFSPKDADYVGDSRFLLFELSGIITDIESPIVLTLQNDCIKAVQIQNSKTKNILSVFIMIKDEIDVFEDTTENSARLFMDKLILSVIANGINTDFETISYELSTKFDKGTEWHNSKSNSCIWYSCEGDEIKDDFKNLLIGATTNYSDEVYEKLLMLSAIVSMDNIKARYILIYEMLCNLLYDAYLKKCEQEIVNKKKGKQEIVNKYIDHVFEDKLVDRSGVLTFNQGDTTPYGIVKHDNVSNFTILRNAIAHINDGSIDYNALENDVWSHTRPLVNVLVYAIKERC